MRKWILLLTLFYVPSLQAAEPPPTPTPPPQFAGEGEAGAIIVSGTADSESYAAKTKLAYHPGDNLYQISGHYLRATANGVESARNWDATFRYERELGNDYSSYLSYKSESDVYAGFVQRDSPEIGAKYLLIKHDDLTWSAELGARYSTTLFVDFTKTYDTFGRLYSEINRTLSQTVIFKFWLEYLPNFTSPKAYLGNTELSLNVMLSKILSLKIGYLLQYQNQPVAGAQHTEKTTTMNLVAKF